MTSNIKHLKDLLLKESGVLEKDLASLGRKNVDKAGDWEAVAKDLDEDNADEFDVANDLGRFENSKAELEQLEIQLSDVKSALKKIESGKYGICEICNKPIESDRLKVNPSAKTCKLHMNN